MSPECTWTHGQLADLLDCTLPSYERTRVQSHLTGCARCTADYDGIRVLLSSLNHMARPALPEGFSRRLSSRIQQEASRMAGADAAPSLGRRLIDWIVDSKPLAPLLVGGAVASLAFFAIWSDHQRFTTAPVMAQLVGAPTTVASVSVGGDATVRIWFRSDRVVDNVQFSLTLPAGLRLVQNGKLVDTSSLTWRGRLESGRNLIPLTVRGIAGGDWTVRASLAKGTSRQESVVDLHVKGA